MKCKIVEAIKLMCQYIMKLTESQRIRFYNIYIYIYIYTQIIGNHWG